MGLRTTLLAAIAAAAIASGCADVARLPEAETIGPSPVLPPPSPTFVPTVDIARARGWTNGATPRAVAPLAVTAFAEQLSHPRWLHVLPNGDILVAETNAPPRSATGGLKEWAMGVVMKVTGAAVPSANRISLLRDADGDGKAETRSAFSKASSRLSAWH